MVLFNYSTRELTAKIVYYGPGLCGKTTNLQYIFDNLPGSVKGKMLSLATKTDRTLFFDFLPLDLGEIRGMKTRIQLYTVPGQVFYNETRRLVLKGADGVVFVADSQKAMLEANVDSYRNLEENLRVHSMRLSEMPLVIQYNKRDLPNLASVEDLNTAVNRFNSPFYESVATTGIGVQDTLKAITKLVLLHLTKKYDARQKPMDKPASPVPIVQGSQAPGRTAHTGQASPAISRSFTEHLPQQTALGTAPATAIDESMDSDEEVVELSDVMEDTPADDMAAEPIDLLDEVEEPSALARDAGGSAEREFEIDHSVEGDADDGETLSGPGAFAEGSLPVSPETRDLMVTPTRFAIEEVPTEDYTAGAPPAIRVTLGQPRDIAVPIEVSTPTGVRKLTLSIRIDLSESSINE